MHHPAWASPLGARRRERARDTVQRIADTLGIPAQTLWDAADAEHYPDDTAELVRLWFKIGDDAERQQLLAMVCRTAGTGYPPDG